MARETGERQSSKETRDSVDRRQKKGESEAAALSRSFLSHHHVDREYQFGNANGGRRRRRQQQQQQQQQREDFSGVVVFDVFDVVVVLRSTTTTTTTTRAGIHSVARVRCCRRRCE
jgi:hypothetical protein